MAIGVSQVVLALVFSRDAPTKVKMNFEKVEADMYSNPRGCYGQHANPFVILPKHTGKEPD